MEHTVNILLFIALLGPLVSFAIAAPARAGAKTLPWVCTTLLFASFCSAAYLLASHWNQPPLVVTLPWFDTGDASFTVQLLRSNRSVLMLTVVAFISLLVHLYSTAYMKHDRHVTRYFAMLGFFTFAMQGIVLSDSLLFLFVFWELVGFSSYMLIGHWMHKEEAGRASTKAFVMNRIGDAGFLVGLMIVWATFNTFSLTTILDSPGNIAWQTAASLCIFCGVIGKSAQFPLFTWLADAMEGPTPVSALIHAATMVVAGVYLLIRIFGLFTETALLVVAITGTITTVIGALAALSQYDMKKILAYSTMSQLGLMVLAIGMGVVDAAFLHLLTHAFFKACLFLSAGMIIHALHDAKVAGNTFDVQDIRHLGGLRKKMPFTFVTFAIGGASLAGVPFFSGFLSKEAIITALFMHSGLASWLMIVVILGVSFLTIMYTFRMIWFIFLGEGRTIRTLAVTDPAENSMRIAVGILAFCSLWFLVSWNPFNFMGWIPVMQQTSSYLVPITIFSVLWVVAAIALSVYFYTRRGFKTSALLHHAFYVDHVYAITTQKVLGISAAFVDRAERKVIDACVHSAAYGQVILAHIVAWIDRVFIDGTVNGAARLTGLGGKVTRSFQAGNIQLYLFWAAFGIFIFIIWAFKK